jgi:hypothetical protein
MFYLKNAFHGDVFSKVIVFPEVMKVDLYLRREAFFTTTALPKILSISSSVLLSIVSSRFMSPSVFQKQRNSCELPHDVVPASRSDEQPPSRWSR